MARVYLDWNATTPPLEAVSEAMAEAAREAWGNPSSVHATGRAARARVEDARAAIAELMEADPRDVVLTSGGTEANNLALRSAFADGKGGMLVTSRLEHPSVARVAEALEREGRARLEWISVREDGRVDVDHIARALRQGGVRLVAVQAVNHETGVIQDVGAIAELAREHGAALHVDAIQSIGRLANVHPGADTRSVAAHKMRGPKGIGALVLRPGAHISPILVGGSQERGVRPGTVDPIAAAGFGVAARHARSSPSRYAALAALRDVLERILVECSGARVNGTAARAPHITNVACAGWAGPELAAALDLEGISISSGSACSAGTSEPSPVLQAMFGVNTADDARPTSSVRFSLGELTTEGEIATATAAFARVMARARAS